MTVTREGQDTSSIVAVRNQSTEVVLYTFTHPPGPYTFRLREHRLGSEDENGQQVGEVLTGPQEMLQVRLGSYTSNGSDIEKYALLVPGNEMTNGSTVRCTYREPGGSEFVGCDCLNRTTFTVMVFEEIDTPATTTATTAATTHDATTHNVTTPSTEPPTGGKWQYYSQMCNVL